MTDYEKQARQQANSDGALCPYYSHPVRVEAGIVISLRCGRRWDAITGDYTR